MKPGEEKMSNKIYKFQQQLFAEELSLSEYEEAYEKFKNAYQKFRQKEEKKLSKLNLSKNYRKMYSLSGFSLYI